MSEMPASPRSGPSPEELSDISLADGPSAELRFRVATRAAHGIVYECDLDSGRVERSEGLADVLGFLPEEVPAEADWWNGRVHPDDLPRLERRWERGLASADRIEAEYRVCHREGTWRVVWDQAHVVRDATGRPRRLIGCAVDVTDRKRMESRLRRSEERLRLAQRAGRIGLFDYDVANDRTDWDLGIRHLFGFSEQDVVDTGAFLSRVHPEDRDRVAAALGDAFVSDGPGRYEVVYRAIDPADGSLRWVEARGDVTFVDGVARRLVGTLADVTARVAADEELRFFNERLEDLVAERTAVADRRARRLKAMAVELNRSEQQMRDRLARTIHDDLQQTLVAAKMHAACAGGPDGDAPLATTLTLIDEALATSRKLVHEFCPPVMPHGSLADAVRWLAERMEAHHRLRVEITIAGDPVDAAEEAKAFVFDAVRELLFNVVKHAEVDAARVAVVADGGQFDVTVADDGVGFDPATVTPSGSGYGLYAVKRRIEALGGTLSFEAAEGQGCRVRFRLPTG